jgi:hypothetical protein
MKQSAYLKTLERKSAFWKTFTAIGLPVAALLGAGVTAGLMAAR